MEILWTILIGLVAGFIASRVMKSGGYGLVGDLVVGVIGAVVGNWLFTIAGLPPHGILIRILAATLGAMLFIALIRFIRRKVR
jgi:uncharacterized membrane protein YeaQ/YmgE (transglycosylase-associated protein family)